MKRGDISERIAVGGQPSADDLHGLKSEGFAAVINLRRDGEANQPLDPVREGLAAAIAGLKYYHIPVNSDDPRHDQVAALRAALDQVAGPVYVHCQGGGRACTMALLAAAPPTGYGAQEMMAAAEAAGFPVTKPVVAEFISTVLERKS